MENSSLIALRNAAFRRFWFASILSVTAVGAQDCAAVWAMYKLGSSPLFLAFFFLLAAVVLMLWKRETAPSKLPLGNFFESFFTAIRYVRHSPEVQVILVRSAAFTFCISLIPAIGPVIGLKEVGLNAVGCGLMFSGLGGGSAVAALIVMAWIRAARTRISKSE